jgi:lactate dehydrogenase-like 2-hydroxyacid dehydrogenase
LPQLTAEQAEHWIAAALTEAKALRQYDDQLYPAAGDAAGMQVAQQLRSAWQRWADDADALYERIRPLLKGERYHVAGAGDLDYEIARAIATLKMTPESTQAARAQIARDEYKTIEEVRRELRAAHQR